MLWHKIVLDPQINYIKGLLFKYISLQQKIS